MSAAATPKQIRELMNVDGLTNDEVKSHLQVCMSLRQFVNCESFMYHSPIRGIILDARLQMKPNSSLTCARLY